MLDTSPPLLPDGGSSSSGVGVMEHPRPFVTGNLIQRMRTDLQRALAKTISERKWTMVIDLQKCIGCRACTVACMSENNLPPGVAYRPVLDEEIGKYPNVQKRFTPRPCMQCDDPPCVPPCPVGATFKRPDGIVVIDYSQCIGCRYCITACPYGARYFDFGGYYNTGTPRIMDYETRPSPEYGEDRTRLPDQPTRSPKYNARKCHFCLHRLNSGMLPACVTTCLGTATYFGDLKDGKALVNELLGSARIMRLKEDLGTEPSVYYLL